MKNTISCFIICFVLSGLSFLVKGQTTQNNDFTSKELQIRNGLSNFTEKVNKKDSIRVAYLGGSITEQNGWRRYSLEWFRQSFPKVKFIEINAAIGGTGSDFGAFRLQDHVLKFKPDLVFVEFGVNDNGVAPGRITRSMEGIVRQIWLDNPSADICFIYTIMDGYMIEETAGKLPQSIQIMEKVATKYSIPSINYGYEICRRVENKHLIFTGKSEEDNGIMVFSPDGVHPFPNTGQKIYLDVLTRSFKRIMQNSTQKNARQILPQPIDPNCFVNTQMIDISEVNLSKEWKMLSIKDNSLFSEFTKYVQTIGQAEPDSKLNFRFKGRSFGIFDIIGPGSGSIEVTVDGNVTDTIMRFDPYCTYWRKHYFVIDQLKDTEHKVSIRVLSDQFDKVSILSRLNRTMKDPQQYKEYNWYVGKILIDGSYK